jgi:hypothetical protein
MKYDANRAAMSSDIVVAYGIFEIGNIIPVLECQMNWRRFTLTSNITAVILCNFFPEHKISCTNKTQTGPEII